MNNNILYILYGCLAAGSLGLIYAKWKAWWIKKQDPGNEKMQEISNLVREGAMVFLTREYKALFKVVVVATGVIYLLNYYMGDPALRWAAFSYPVGAIFSAFTGYLGMRAATLANCRTTQAATTSLEKALLVAFGGGTVMGTYVASFVVLGITGLFLFYLWLFGGDMATINQISLPVLLTYGAGGSTVAIFARVGGGIYTKAADVGADIAGKIVAGIPEDDPRNPAVIADNVGDNVGDIAGMGADLFESCAGAIICAMIFGAYIGNMGLTILPLALAAVGIIASIIGSFFVRTKEGGNPQTALNMSNFSSLALVILFAYPTVNYLCPETFVSAEMMYLRSGVFYSLIIGVVSGALIGFVAQYFTSSDFAPVKMIAKAAESGAGTVVIAGLAIGMLSIGPIIAVLVIGMKLAYFFAGFLGIAIASAGMLSTVGSQLSVDAYGPIADNAGGLAEMVGLPDIVRARTDSLDAVGNTTAAMGKGYAIASAALAAGCLFVAYEMATGLSYIDLGSADGLIGGFIGAAIPFIFSALAFLAVGDAAHDIAMEVARQFRETAGLLAGDPNAQADHVQCVDIATKAAISKMILPGLIALLTPVLVGFIGGKVMLGGMLAGNLLVGVSLAICLSNAGGAWDNAKKYIEGGAFGKGNGKGSEMHKAAVTGDTVGDPCKDTAGPSLNILIKLTTIVALIIATMI
jgi:K(+)-stimulated pyrophosphate-energized sodium pump